MLRTAKLAMRGPPTNRFTFAAMRILTLFLLASLISSAAIAQSVKRIRLNPPKARTPLSKIRVTEVVDDRDDTTIIGIMRAGIANKNREVSLEGGVADAAFTVLARYQNPSPKAEDVKVHIRGLEIKETKGAMRERVTITYKYAFVGTAAELAYEGSAYMETSMDASAYIERLVRESLVNTFDRVAESWQDPSTAVPPNVTVSVKVEPQPASSGLHNFDPKHPMTFDDFKGVPDDLSGGVAATYTGISFAYSAQQSGSDFKIIVTLTPIADPEKSWMRASGRKPEVLAHENLHLAITANIACKLADSMRRAPVAKDDFDTRLRLVFNYFERQLEQAQRRYDQETDHGRKAPQQAVWKQTVYSELRSGRCYAGLD